MNRPYRYLAGLFLKSELLRNASILISGNVLSQMVSILLQPLIRRLYTPADFGVFTVYMSLIGICIIFSSLKYDDAIVLPKTDKESLNLLSLAMILNFCICLCIFIIIVIARKKLLVFLNLPSDFPMAVLMIIPFGVFLGSSFGSLNSWLIRKRKYISVSVNKLVRRSVEGVSQVGLALMGQPGGLIFSDISGQSANVLTAAAQSQKNKLDVHLISWAKIKYVLRKYSEFPRYNLLPALMSSCSYLLPPIFINKYYSPESAGFFDFSKMVLSIPLAFIASSFSSILLQKISEKFNRKESVLNDLKPIIVLVLLVSIFEVLIILLWGEDIFRIAFGKQWNYSGVISRILVWSFAVNFIISSFSSLFVAMRRIKIYGMWQLIYFISILSLLLFRNIPFESFLKLYVGIEVTCYVGAGFLIAYILRKYESDRRKVFLV